jgi:peptidyl-prolyl cis-trans isomerase B (cyclophilin B)
MKTQIINIVALFALILSLSSCGVTAEFAYEAEELVAPAVVDFENQSEKAEAYEWFFGDGDTAQVVDPSHRYTASGNYEVRLRAKKGKRTSETTKRIVVKPPQQCLVEIQTDYGDMLVQLYDDTPKHRDNFLKLAEEGFYDSLLFHRVIDGFMIQGGDPNSKEAKSGEPLGGGGPGYQIDAEFEAGHLHMKGALAAARTGDNANPQRRSSGSQFYIVQGREVQEMMLKNIEKKNGIRYEESDKLAYQEKGGTPFLDGQYTVFGQVIEGLEVIDKITKVSTNGRNRPDEDVRMKVIVIK